MKYIHNTGLPLTAYDESSDIYFALMALPDDRRPIFLEATDPLVVAFLAAIPTPTSVAWERIKEERDRRETGGYKVGAVWYHSDAPSIAKYGTFLSMAVEKSLPPETEIHPAWKDMAGNFAPMTVTLLRQIRDVGIAQVGQIFSVSESHKAAMLASADPAGYDFSNGWPAIYAT